MNHTTQKEIAFWNSLAPKYDRVVDGIAAKTYRRLLAELAGDVAGAHNVLEIATGTGIFALQLSPQVKSITAIDLAPEMIKVALEKCRQLNLQNLTFRLGDAHHLEFADTQFDAIIASNVMHLLPHPELALQEMKRVLTGTGKIILPTYLHGANLQSKILSHLMGLSGFRARNRWSEAAFKDFLAGNGLQIVKEQILPDKIPLIYLVLHKTTKVEGQ